MGLCPHPSASVRLSIDHYQTQTKQLHWCSWVSFTALAEDSRCLQQAEISEGKPWPPCLLSLPLWSTALWWEAAESSFPGPAEGGWWQELFIHFPVTFQSPFPFVLQRETCQFSSQQDYQSCLPLWSFPLLKVSDGPLLWFHCGRCCRSPPITSRSDPAAEKLYLRETKSPGNRGSGHGQGAAHDKWICQMLPLWILLKYALSTAALSAWRELGDKRCFYWQPVTAWPGSPGAVPWHTGITIPCKCAKCWLLCGPETTVSFDSILPSCLFRLRLFPRKLHRLPTCIFCL